MSRLVLGAVTPTSGPTLASLTGDFFASRERGKIYGFILTGDLLGSVIGLFLSGNAAAISWRLAFWVLVIPSALYLRSAGRRRPGHPRLGPGRHVGGISDAFLVMLIPLAAGGLILLRARRDYPRDVATATASEAALGGPGDREPGARERDSNAASPSSPAPSELLRLASEGWMQNATVRRQRVGYADAWVARWRERVPV